MIDPYATTAAFYDAELDDGGADLAGYSRRAVGGPVLVLGCGTGRVCRALEGAHAVTGLDRSEAMLARAHGRARYVLGDMRSFELGSFAEVILPHGAFCFLPTRADQAACLASIRRALPGGAPVTLDLPMPDFSLLGQAHTSVALAWEGLLDGRPARRTREVFRYPVAQRIELLDRFYVEDHLITESTLVLRLVFPAEVEWMLESAGFWVDSIWGDHAERPLREGCDRLLVRAISG